MQQIYLSIDSLLIIIALHDITNNIALSAMLLHLLSSLDTLLRLSLLTALHRISVILAMLCRQELERTPANYCRAAKVIKAKRTFPAACESFIVMSNLFHRR